jgi:hypothetical protein
VTDLRKVYARLAHDRALMAVEALPPTRPSTGPKLTAERASYLARYRRAERTAERVQRYGWLEPFIIAVPLVLLVLLQAALS